MIYICQGQSKIILTLLTDSTEYGYRITRFQSESVFLRMETMYHSADPLLFFLLQIPIFFNQRFFLIGQGGGNAVRAGGGRFLGCGESLQGGGQAAGEL